MTPLDTDVLRLSFFIAAAIVAVGAIAAAVLSGVFIQRSYQRRVTAAPEVPRDHDLALLMYAGSAFFWPAGLAFAITLSQARTARTCGLITVGHFLLIALGTCAAFAGLAAYPAIWK